MTRPTDPFGPQFGPPKEPQPDDPDDLPREAGLPLALRLLALLGAVSFLMIGLSSVVPLLRPSPPDPLLDQRRGPMA